MLVCNLNLNGLTALHIARYWSRNQAAVIAANTNDHDASVFSHVTVFVCSYASVTYSLTHAHDTP